MLQVYEQETSCHIPLANACVGKCGYIFYGSRGQISWRYSVFKYLYRSIFRSRLAVLYSTIPVFIRNKQLCVVALAKLENFFDDDCYFVGASWYDRWRHHRHCHLQRFWRFLLAYEQQKTCHISLASLRLARRYYSLSALDGSKSWLCFGLGTLFLVFRYWLADSYRSVSKLICSKLFSMVASAKYTDVSDDSCFWAWPSWVSRADYYWMCSFRPFLWRIRQYVTEAFFFLTK